MRATSRIRPRSEHPGIASASAIHRARFAARWHRYVRYLLFDRRGVTYRPVEP